MVIQNNNSELKRRKVLHSIGASVGGVTALSTVGSARPSGTVVGISYDTLTQEPGKVVRGNVTEANGELRGALSIAGFAVPMEQLNVVSADDGRRKRYSETLDEDQFVKDDSPLKVTVTDHGDHYSGILSRPSPEFGHLDFFARNESEINPGEELEKQQPTKNGLTFRTRLTLAKMDFRRNLALETLGN